MSYFDEHQIFYINSKNRINGTNSNFTYKLEIDRNILYDSVVLLDASIPKSYYTVQDGYNIFSIVENNTTTNITISPGNYTRTSFKNELEYKLNLAGLGRPSWVYTVSYQNIGLTVDTGHLFFNVVGPILEAEQPTFIFYDGLYEQMGFNENTTYNFVNNNLESINVINLNPEQSLYIRSDICQNENNNILDNIITSYSSSYAQINYINNIPNETTKIFNGNGNNIFRFILTDENDINIDLQGQNMIFTIMIYKKNKIFSLLQGFIKYITFRI